MDPLPKLFFFHASFLLLLLLLSAPTAVSPATIRVTYSSPLTSTTGGNGNSSLLLTLPLPQHAHPEPIAAASVSDLVPPFFDDLNYSFLVNLYPDNMYRVHFQIQPELPMFQERKSNSSAVDSTANWGIPNPNASSKYHFDSSSADDNIIILYAILLGVLVWAALFFHPPNLNYRRIIVLVIANSIFSILTAVSVFRRASRRHDGGGGWDEQPAFWVCVVCILAMAATSGIMVTFLL